MTLQEAVQALDRPLLLTGPNNEIFYMSCPTGCGGFLIRFAYDAAKCPQCGLEERYLD